MDKESRVTLLVLLIVSLSLLRASVAFACNGAPPPSVPDAFRDADFVVTAKAISVHRQLLSPNDISYVVEKDTFKVLHTFKGKYAPGDLLLYVTTIGIGSCGVSAKGVVAGNKRGKLQRYNFSGTWLLYGGGSEPYELSLMSSRTAPMEYGGDADVKELRRLTAVKGSRRKKSN